MVKAQQKSLRMMVRHAYQNVKYYRRLFRSLGKKPEDISTVDDLSKLPLLTKHDIQEKYQDFVASSVNKNECITRRTSGSTGIPLTVLFDTNALDFMTSRNLRSFFACGLGPRDKMATISNPHNFSRKRWFQSFGFFRREWLSIFDSAESNITKISKIRPDIIEGIPSTLLFLAEAAQEREAKEINPRLVYTSCELLTPQARKTINSVFAETYDFYGSVEFGRFAWECPEHIGYHIDIDSVVLEIVRGEEAVSPGEKGQIVVTGLFNYAMPLIRYRLGDIGTLSNEHCSCGRELPLMKIIYGREDDFLVLPSGRVLPPYFAAGELRYMDGLKKYRIIQEKKDEFEVQVVKGKNFSQKTIIQIKDKLLSSIGEKVKIKVILVDEISIDRSGKLRKVISKVKKPAEFLSA